MLSMEVEYRVVEYAWLKGLIVNGVQILETKFSRIDVYVPGYEGVSPLLPYLVVIAKDINWEYEIYTMKPQFEGARILSHWSPRTQGHSGFELRETHIYNRELGLFYPNGMKVRMR